MRAGERIRVTAQLIKAKPERHLWAETFDNDLVDVLALHSEVAQAIAGKIKIAITPEEQTRLASTPPVNPAAYEAYLKGRYHWNKRIDEGLKQSLEYFQQAIAADPNHALGYAGLADSYNMLGGYRLLSPKDAFPQARAAAVTNSL